MRNTFSLRLFPFFLLHLEINGTIIRVTCDHNHLTRSIKFYIDKLNTVGNQIVFIYQESVRILTGLIQVNNATGLIQVSNVA